MRFFKLILSYDGTAYAGWQVQANGRTIQAELEAALQRVTGRPVRAIASGRTDAGVHALGQTVSFCSDTHLPPDTLGRALNANLPRDIVVIEMSYAADGFHAIRDAVAKTYRYIIQDGPVPDVLTRAYSWQISQRLNDAAMQQGADRLCGTHDFSSFEAAGSPRASSVRTVHLLHVCRRGGDHLDRIVIEITADGFLYNMVRNIVGTLADVGRGKYPPSRVSRILAAGDRKQAGMTAPPQGLFLVSVDYGDATDWGG